MIVRLGLLGILIVSILAPTLVLADGDQLTASSIAID